MLLCIHLLRRCSELPRIAITHSTSHAGKTGDQYIEALSKVCDGLRVAAQEVDFDDLFEILEGRPRGIDTLINHMQGMVFSLTEHESKDYFSASLVVLEDPCPDKMESV